MINFARCAAMLAFFLLGMINAQGEATNACTGNSLVDSYLKSHPGWMIVKVSDLPLDDQQLWRQYHAGQCPGLTVGSLDSSGRTWYALGLMRKVDENIEEQAVLLTGKERVTLSHTLSAPKIVVSPFVIWRAAPGTYLNYRTGRRVTLRYDSFVYEKMESTSTQYYLHEGRIKSLLASY